MIRYIIGVLFIIIAAIVGLSLYLQPDDISECHEYPNTIQNCQVVDAIIAVSGGDTEARTKEAVKLYKNGWSQKLIFSGAAQDKSGPSNANAMKTIATNLGVPETDIYLDEYSETTKQNAENSQDIFIEHNIDSVILVTSGYHQRRASLEFNKRSINVTIINHPTQVDKDWSSMWWLTLRGWWLGMSEIVKISVFYTIGN